MSINSFLPIKEVQMTGPDAAEVLALVSANIPLPKHLAATLRLVCRATKLAVDQGKTFLAPRIDKLEAVRLGDNPLTSALTLIHFIFKHATASPLNTLNACLLASHHCKTLESLFFGYMERAPCNFLEAMATLGSREWPKLDDLMIHCIPGVARRIKLENMSKLTQLHLSGELESSDVAALNHCTLATSRLVALTLGVCGSENDAVAMFEEVSKLLQSTSKLRNLTLCLCYCRDASFLAAAELPFLEYLHLHGFDKLSLEPLVRVARPRLEELNLQSIMPSPADLLPLFTHSWALSALTYLSLGGFMMDDWSFLCEIELKTIEWLSLIECWMTTADLAHVGAAAAHLPALKSLDLTLKNIEDEGNAPFPAAAAMRTLLSGPPLSSLKELRTGKQWKDNDASIKCLIELADKVPQLEVLEMEEGRISADGFAALAAAGRRGRLPKLDYLVIAGFVGEVPESTKKDLREVFPNLVVDIMPQPGGAGPVRWYI